MRDLHPDKQQGKNLADQKELEQQAAAITNAYDTLKRPHVRATHLLELLGFPIEGTGTLSGDFLAQIMRVREEIDAARSDVEMKPLFDANVRRIDQTCRDLEAAFQTKDMNKALQLTAELQYWNRIDETLRDKMESLE